MKIKYIPNALSIARLLLCIPLVILTPFSTFYIVLFVVAGLTDLLDGKLARRIKDGASELGATLDSIADVCLIAVIMLAIMPKMEIWSWLQITYICVLLLKVIASTGIGFIKFKEIISLHTISLKVLFTALFGYPILYKIVGAGLFINVFSVVLISFALLIVIEEILIISLLKKPARNIKSIFGVGAANKAANLSVEA